MVDAATKRQALRRMELLDRANRFVVEQNLLHLNTESEMAIALSAFTMREIANALSDAAAEEIFSKKPSP